MSKTLQLPERNPRIEAKLDKAIKASTGKGPGDFTPSGWQGFREQVRLCMLYRGKYVLFRDHHEGEGNNRRLVYREVLATSRSLWPLSKKFASFHRQAQLEMGLTFVDQQEQTKNGEARAV